ncbi:glycosyltransferase family 25 protein [bacterium]|nr:glycosyltransferase family 25 protein [bacterium]MDB9951842.1 glycosyltransferase family 25 protein [Porticoccaceae bacterium]MDB9999737.1 glycosyltransferase family 25 protein [Porticoccaceae bacterium]
MNIFVVNLDKSTQRLAEMSQRLEQLSLPFTRVSAVYGASLTDDELNLHYSSALNERVYRRPLSAAEIGCYLSHRNTWQTIVDGNLSMALILEDDAELGAQLPAALAVIENLERSWDIIKLYEPQIKKPLARSIPLNQDFSLCQYKKIPSTSTGYMVSLAGASKLLGAREMFGRPVDDDIQFYWEYSGEVYGVKPYPIVIADSSLESTIGPDGQTRSRKSIIGTMRGPLLRLGYEMLRIYHNFQRPKLKE